MKKAVKGIFIGTGILVLVTGIIIALLAYKFNAETKKMYPLPTKLVAGGIYAVGDGGVNLYIVQKGDAIIAIDAAKDQEKIKWEMAAAKLDPLKVKAVFLTHTDSDHIAALPLFKNAAVYLSKAEEQMINGKTARALVFHNEITGPYKTFADGETIEIAGIQVRCFITPGHTPGSSCFLVEGKYLFSGDSLKLKDGRVALFNELFNMDSEAERRSWPKIMDLPGAVYILTAHHGTTDDYRKAFEGIGK